MRMTLDEITALGREVAREFSNALEVTSVVSIDGESEHVELLLSVSGCHEEPCSIVVNLPRDDAAMQAEMRARMREAIAAHALLPPQSA
jgi:hypothetical protein